MFPPLCTSVSVAESLRVVSFHRISCSCTMSAVWSSMLFVMSERDK